MYNCDAGDVAELAGGWRAGYGGASLGWEYGWEHTGDACGASWAAAAARDGRCVGDAVRGGCGAKARGGAVVPLHDLGSARARDPLPETCAGAPERRLREVFPKVLLLLSKVHVAGG